MAADLTLVRCVVWGLLTQSSHGQTPQRALPCRADTIYVCCRVLLFGLYIIFSLGLLVLPMSPGRLKSWRRHCFLSISATSLAPLLSLLVLFLN